MSHTFIHAPYESSRKLVFIQVYTCTAIFVQGCVKETRSPELSSVTQRHPNTAAAFKEELLLLQRALVVQGGENQRTVNLCYCNPEPKPPSLCFKHSDKHSYFTWVGEEGRKVPISSGKDKQNKKQKTPMCYSKVRNTWTHLKNNCTYSLS